jgi:hypothetical protein
MEAGRMRPIQHYERFLNQHEVRHLYYMAPLDNAALIVCFGIFSFNHMKDIPHRNIASDAVQRRRAFYVPSSGRSVHDYVPLYFATHTPMQRRLTHGTGVHSPQLTEDALAIFELSARRLFALEDVVFTDGNAASSRTQFFDDTAQFGRLNWDIIRNRRCYSDRFRWRKAAEVLVPDRIDPSLIEQVITCSDESRTVLIKLVDQVRKQLAATGSKPRCFPRGRFKVNPDMYFGTES